MAVHIPKFPHKLEELLGREGTDEYIDFLNETLYANKEDVVQVVGDKFDRRLVEETSRLRYEMNSMKTELKSEINDLRIDMTEMKAELKGDIAVLRSELKDEIGGLRSELKDEIGGLRSEMERGFTGLHREISGIHKDNSNQTKWLLAVFLAAGVLYPILNQLVIRFVH